MCIYLSLSAASGRSDGQGPDTGKDLGEADISHFQPSTPSLYPPEADFQGAISPSALFLGLAACRVPVEAIFGDV
jgi:hypothetical protein